MRDRLNSLRGRKFVGVSELADEGARLLLESGVMQEKGTVSDVPDERTVRYYLAEGLIAPSEERQGTASVFGYRHLLQLLVIKNLQAQHLPIRKIRELVEGRSERDLERMLGRDTKPSGKNTAFAYLESLLTDSRSQRRPQMDQADLSRAQDPMLPNGPLPSAAPPRASEGGTWERIELEPGLELHVQSSYEPPREAKGIRRLAQLVMSAIESHGQKLTGKRGK